MAALMGEEMLPPPTLEPEDMIAEEQVEEPVVTEVAAEVPEELAEIPGEYTTDETLALEGIEATTEPYEPEAEIQPLAELPAVADETAEVLPVEEQPEVDYELTEVAPLEEQPEVAYELTEAPPLEEQPDVAYELTEVTPLEEPAAYGQEAFEAPISEAAQLLPEAELPAAPEVADLPVYSELAAPEVTEQAWAEAEGVPPVEMEYAAPEMQAEEAGIGSITFVQSEEGAGSEPMEIVAEVEEQPAPPRFARVSLANFPRVEDLLPPLQLPTFSFELPEAVVGPGEGTPSQ